MTKFAYLASASAVIALSGCGPRGKVVDATVTYIDRTCTIITETTTEHEIPNSGGATANSVTKSSSQGDCKSVDEWEKVRTKRKKDIDGHADVHFDYVAPSNGQHYSGELTFDGREEEFYALRSGDVLKVRVSDTNPDQVWKV